MENDKLIFINGDDELQIKQLDGYINHSSFGSSINDQTTISFLEANPYVQVKYNDLVIKSKLIGKYNYGNISAAIAIGKHFEVNDSDIKSAIESYTPKNNRSQIMRIGSNKIVLDAYNANPSSMKAALESFSNLKGEYKIVILGDMFELGQDADKEHQSIVEYAEQLGFNNIYLVGENFYNTTIKSPNILKFKVFEDLKKKLKSTDSINSTILIKGSRGIALERVLDLL